GVADVAAQAGGVLADRRLHQPQRDTVAGVAVGSEIVDDAGIGFVGLVVGDRAVVHRQLAVRAVVEDGAGVVGGVVVDRAAHHVEIVVIDDGAAVGILDMGVAIAGALRHGGVAREHALAQQHRALVEHAAAALGKLGGVVLDQGAQDLQVAVVGNG